MKKSQLRNIIKEEISKVLNETTLNESSESELIDIYKPTAFWKDFREVLEKELANYKMEASGWMSADGDFDGGSDWNVVQLPFISNTWGVSTRTVHTRSHSSRSDDNELMSKTQITISVDGVMDISMVVERNHADGNFAVRSSDLKWFHPFKESVFEMDLGMSYSAGDSGRELVDYIVKDIKYAVKKRGKIISGAIFKIVESD